MAEKFAEAILATCMVIIVASLAIIMLTFMMSFLIDMVLEIKEKIEEMFW